MQTSLLTHNNMLSNLETKLQEGTETHLGLHSISPIPTHGWV